MYRAKQKSSVAIVFPGQGSQRVGMGRDLYMNFPSARAVFEEADEALGFSLSHLCFEGPEEKLRQTINAQPAILTTSMACWKVAQEMGLLEKDLKPTFVAGHSLGEYTCLAAAEVLDFSHAVHLARERGRLMQEAGQKRPGGMVAILGLDVTAVEEICRETGTQIANINCSGQIVISGPQESLEKAIKLAEDRGARRAIRLEVSGAFHSSLMRLAMRGLAKVLSLLHFHHPRIPIVANTTARPMMRADEVCPELERQLCRCVQWQSSVEYMDRAGVTTFVEVGPGQVLTGLIQRISPQAQTLNISDVPSLQRVAAQLGTSQ